MAGNGGKHREGRAEGMFFGLRVDAKVEVAL